MSYTIERYRECHLKEIQSLFKEVFAHNQDIDKIDISKKLNTQYTGSANLIVLVRDEQGELAGALGIYPVLMEYKNQVIKAGQIGDAMVRAAHRGKGLFSKTIRAIIDWSREEGIEIIYTLPSVKNVGSYKGFQKTNFVEVDTLFTYTFSTSASFLSRILRKLSKNLYNSYSESKLKRLDNYSPSGKIECGSVSIPRTKEYVNYKKFNSNHHYQLNSGKVWLNIGKYNIKVGDYEIEKTSNFDLFIEELRVLCFTLGKDNFTFMHNLFFEDSLSGFNSNTFNKSANIKLMVFYINEHLKGLDWALNFVDSDTF